MRVVTLLAFLMLAGAGPAAAHDVSEHAEPGVATNLRSAVVSAPLPDGVTLDVLSNGQALRLHNGADTPVTVLHADGGERLRVLPGDTARWHEDGAHPTASVGPGRPVAPWRVTVLAGGQRYDVTGEVRWSPGPSPWPWLGGAALLAVMVAAAGRLAAALALGVAGSVAHTAAALAARTAEGPRWALLGDYLPQAGCWTLGVVAVVLLARGRRDGIWLGALAAAGLLLLALTRDAAVLGASTVLVALPAGVDRALVTLTAGLTAGVLAGLLLVARQPVGAPSASSS